MKGICLLIDRLHVGYVGAYGNSWIETPSLDRLAAESFLLDRYWIDSPRLDLLYRSLWQGRHAMSPEVAAAQEPSLASLISAAGIPAALVSDDPAVLDHALAQGFGRRLSLSSTHSTELADQWEESRLAEVFAELLQWLDTTEESAFAWCHLKGLGGAWDAPYELRARYAADEDPDPPRSAEVPALVLDEDYDPDLLLGITQSYAGQVTLLDRCLGAFVEWLETSPRAQDALVLVASARGFPLGEHHLVGGEAAAVHGELAHVPAMLRLPGGDGAAGRTQALVEPADLFATLLDWFGLAAGNDRRHGRSLLPLARDEVAEVRDRLCVVGDGKERGIITPAWFGRFADKGQLYLKPDDRWEVNDVADRCPEVIERLEAALREAEQRLSQGDASACPALDDLLLHAME